MEPGQLYDLWALAGLPSAGARSVPGIGPRTAARLLAAHGDLAGVLAAAEMLTGKTGAVLREHAAIARWTRDFVRLRDDLSLGTNLRELRRPEHG